MRRWLGWMVIATGMLAASCGSDSVKDKDGASTDCPDGQQWNPVTGACMDDARNVVTATNNGSGTNNDPANNGPATNNDPATNNGPMNNTTGVNNGTNGTNNGTVPTNNTPMACGTGDLVGKTCAPSGEPLAAADVKISGVDCATGQPFELTTRTASDGTFELMDVPTGQHTLTVETGSFNSSRPVIIQKDMTTDLSSAADKVCLNQNVEIAVLTGAYDHVEGILETLNLDFTITGADTLGNTQAQTFLTNLQAMQAYDIIFINCGDLWDNISLLDFGGTTRNTIAANLRAFVQGGGSLYVSDWAAPFVERAFPDMLDFYGNDANHGEARMGYAPQSIAATVLTPELQTVLGRADATIEFPQDPNNGVINNNWAVAAGVGPGATVQLQGDADLCSPSGGIGQTCTSVAGTQAAAPLLVTYKDPSGGTVVYTSFHNERQSALNQDMERILRFLIFQL